MEDLIDEEDTVRQLDPNTDELVENNSTFDEVVLDKDLVGVAYEVDTVHVAEADSDTRREAQNNDYMDAPVEGGHESSRYGE